MAAGLGFKTFVTGDVLTAADANGYLMQGVWVFANAAARTAAVTSPQEGNASFLKDTNALEIYDGAAWVAYGSGDITGVTAGTGISGGGTSGTVTITNSMATEITAAGDIIVGTGSGTFDNLPIGTTGQVLTADTTVSPYKVKWATAGAAAKNYALINAGGTALSGSNSTTINFSGKDSLLIIVTGASCVSGNTGMFLRPNGNTSNANYNKIEIYAASSTLYFQSPSMAASSWFKLAQIHGAADTMGAIVWIDGANSAGYKPVTAVGSVSAQGADSEQHFATGSYGEAAALTSIVLSTLGGANFDAGTIYVYGA